MIEVQPAAARAREARGRPLILAEMTHAEVAEALERTRVALLPIGSTETHGPHMALSVDYELASHTARRAAELLLEDGVEAVVLPTLPYAVCNMGRNFPGTVTVAAETVTDFVSDVLRSMVRHGFRTICVNNAHLEPASVNAWKAACRRVRQETGARIGWLDQRDERWAHRMPEEFNRGDRHAGQYETSMMLAIRPDLVREGMARELPRVPVDLPGAQARGARSFEEAGGKDGYFGDPASATAEEGGRAMETLAQMLREAVLELASEG